MSLVAVLAAVLAVVVSFAPATLAIELRAQPQDWLAAVAYRITPMERDAYLLLKTDRERTAFQRQFWVARERGSSKSRSESPLAVHERRLRDADRLFAEGATTGAQTVRGRVFMLLDAPVDRQVFAADETLVAMEAWTYRGDAALELPPVFGLVFFQSSENGSWELLAPGDENLAQLLRPIAREVAGDKVAGDIANRLKVRSADLAVFAKSPIPGAEIAEGTAFLSWLENLRDVLPFDAPYLQSEQNPTFGLCHGGFSADGQGSVVQLVVEIPPERLTLVADGERFRGVLFVTGWVESVPDGTYVMPVRDRVEIDLNAEELARVQSYPFAYEDIFRMRPGSYRAHLRVRRPTMEVVGSLTQEFVVPAPVAGEMRLSPLLVVARQAPAADGPQRPFVFGDSMYYPARDATVDFVGVLKVAFVLSHPPVAEDVVVPVRYRLSRAGEEMFAGFDRLTLRPAQGSLTAGAITTGMRGIPPGEYRIDVEISSDETAAGKGMGATGSTQFMVVQGAPEVYPWIYLRQRRGDAGTDALSLAHQYLALGDRERAVSELRIAAQHSSSRLPALLRLAEVAIEGRQFAAAIESLNGMSENANSLALIEEWRGQALRGLDRTEEALAAYAQAAARAPRSARLQNALAEVALQTGNKEQALVALKASLVIDADQRQVASQVRTLESRRPR